MLIVFFFHSLHLSDMRRDVQEIFRSTPHGKQVMMFSATLSKDIRPVCKKFMQDVNINNVFISLSILLLLVLVVVVLPQKLILMPPPSGISINKTTTPETPHNKKLFSNGDFDAKLMRKINDAQIKKKNYTPPSFITCSIKLQYFKYISWDAVKTRQI